MTSSILAIFPLFISRNESHFQQSTHPTVVIRAISFKPFILFWSDTLVSKENSCLQGHGNSLRNTICNCDNTTKVYPSSNTPT
jgi:hypothetical protein